MGFTPPYLEVRKVTGEYDIYAPSNTSTDDIVIFPNKTDTSATLKLSGNGGCQIKIYGGSDISFYDVSLAASFLYFNYSTPDCRIYSANNKNIFLSPGGTGKIKFGTHTAQADTPITGYIDILDAAGNARKLAVINP